MKAMCNHCLKITEVNMHQACKDCQEKVDKWTEEVLGLIPNYAESSINNGIMFIPMKKSM